MKLNNLELSPGLIWTNEHTLQEIYQIKKRNLDGSVIIISGTLYGGIEIDIESVQDGGWVKKSVLSQITNMAKVINSQYLLNIRGIDYNVMFRYYNGSPIESTLILPNANPSENDYYSVKLKFITV